MFVSGLQDQLETLEGANLQELKYIVYSVGGSILLWFPVKLIQARVVWEEKTSIKKISSPDFPVNKSLGLFLISD